MQNLIKFDYMTLILGIKACDGVILASDTRNFIGGKTGGEYNDWAVKIFKINEHVGVGIAGFPAIARPIIDKLQGEILEYDGIHEVIEKLIAISKAQAPIIIGDKPQAAFIIIGQIRKKVGLKYEFFGKEIYAYTHNSPVASPYDAYDCEGIRDIANYTIERFYSPEKTVDELTRVAIYSIQETAKIDATVGNKVKILQFKDDGSSYELPETEIKKIASELEQKTDKMREIFWQNNPSGAKIKP